MHMTTLECRWRDESDMALEKLGLESDPKKIILKSVDINMEMVAFVDEYEGMACLNFSAKDGDVMITNVPYKDRATLYR